MDKGMVKVMKKFFTVLITILFCLAFFSSCTHSKTENDDSDKYIVNATFSDYESKDDYITFKTNMILKNTSDKDVYLSFKADFGAEFKIGMIENRILTGYDPETKGNIFMLPSGGEGIFEIWFSSDGNSSIKKPTKLTPEIVCEEISVEMVDKENIVVNDHLTINGEYF